MPEFFFIQLITDRDYVWLGCDPTVAIANKRAAAFRKQYEMRTGYVAVRVIHARGKEIIT